MAYVTLKPRYQIIDGIRCAEAFSPVCFKQALNYKPKPDDLFIVTYPKCGTTWMQNIVLYIHRKGKELEDHMHFFRLSPFIDAFGSQSINLMPRPGAFKTHFPYDRMPYSPDAKYIFVLRNPKDCCTSLFHQTKYNFANGYWDGEFDDFFELFMAGEVEYDDYFDHLMSFYPHRYDRQVFFTTYEDMQKDTIGTVLKVAKFLGEEYIEAIEKDNNVLNNIVNFSSFEYVKKHFSELYDSMVVLTDEEMEDPNFREGLKHIVKFTRSLNPPENEDFQFIRKGVVGDWKNHFSDEQSERLSKKFLNKTQGTEFQDLFKNCM